MKSFILCADDYGLSQTINDAILELIQTKKLQATSCMVNSPHFLNAAELLRPHLNNIQVGLHFNLTEDTPLTPLPKYHFGSLKKLLFLSHLRLLNQKTLEKEFDAQLDRFIKTMGQAPDFIDGHQYVHQFPVIREAMLCVYQKKFSEVKPYIRVPANSFLSTLGKSFMYPKQLAVALTGAFSLRYRLKTLAVPYNTTFSGIYGFSTKKPYARLFPKFLKGIKENGLIVCHPAKPSKNIANHLNGARVQEYLYLKKTDLNVKQSF